MTSRSFLHGPAARFAALSLCGTTILVVLTYLLVGVAPAALGLAVIAYLGAVALGTASMRRAYPHAQVGLCNFVTLFRMLLASVLLAPLLVPAPSWAVIVVATAALVLDGVDGWLARRQGTESEFGARFDMEVDAALGAILALNAFAAGTVGPTVLLLGLPRYVFAAAAWCWPWMSRALPERFSRKVICVVQIVALIALQLPALSGPPAMILVLATLAALCWSFARDLRWLWLQRS